MNSLERVLTVLSGAIPDRVPTALHDYLLAALLAGHTPAECLANGEIMAECQLRSWRQFNHDLLIVEGRSLALAEAMAGAALQSDSEALPIAGPAIKTLDEIDRLRVPNPEKDHPLPEILKAVSILREEVGDRVFIMGGLGQAPLSLAAALRGKAELSADLSRCEDPFRLEHLLDICLEALTKFAAAFQRAGAHGVSLGELESDPVPTGIYRLYALPKLKNFFSAAWRSDFPASLHQCGDNRAVLNDMIATGADILELDERTDMRMAKEACAGTTTILGPIDPENILRRGKPGFVSEKTREAIEILAPGGGFIIGPGCVVTADTPPGNVQALIETARKHGRYKSDGSLAKSRH